MFEGTRAGQPCGYPPDLLACVIHLPWTLHLQPEIFLHSGHPGNREPEASISLQTWSSPACQLIGLALARIKQFVSLLVSSFLISSLLVLLLIASFLISLSPCPHVSSFHHLLVSLSPYLLLISSLLILSLHSFALPLPTSRPSLFNQNYLILLPCNHGQADTTSEQDCPPCCPSHD